MYSPSQRPTAAKVRDLIRNARGVTRALEERAGMTEKMGEILSAVCVWMLVVALAGADARACACGGCLAAMVLRPARPR